MIIQVKGTDRVLLFIMMHKMVLTFDSIDKIILRCDQSNEKYFLVVIMLYSEILAFVSVEEILKRDQVLFILPLKLHLMFKSVV